MFPFMGQTGGELSFNAGDIINLIDYSHDVHAPPSCLLRSLRARGSLRYCVQEWWTGELNGREGSFPCSYVETIDGDEEEQHAEPEPEPTPQAAAHVDYQQHSASSDAVAVVHENATGAQVEVLYDFTPQDDGELECKQGDILDVLDWCVFSPMPRTHAHMSVVAHPCTLAGRTMSGCERVSMGARAWFPLPTCRRSKPSRPRNCPRRAVRTTPTSAQCPGELGLTTTRQQRPVSTTRRRPCTISTARTSRSSPSRRAT